MDEKNTNTPTPNRNVPIASSGRGKTQKVAVSGNTPQQPTDKTSDYNAFASAYKQQREENIQQQQQQQKQQPAAPAGPVVVNNKPGNEKDDKLKNVLILFIILTVVVFAASAAFVTLKILGNKPGNGSINDENNEIVLPESLRLTSPFNYEQTYNVTFPEGMMDKFKDLYAQNQEFIGWLSVPGTEIDTPVYRTSDNAYYLKHDNYGTYTKYGIPFLDMYDSTTDLSRNTVIYGHNFDNRFIFGPLEDYTDIEFYKQHPLIEYDTLYASYKWKVIACFRSNGEAAGDNGYLFYFIAAAMSNDNFMDFYNEVMQRSYIDTGVDVISTDKILTLSTCTYFFDRNGKLENARFTVVARLVREGESEEVDTSKAFRRDEKDVRYPQLYYDVFGGKNPYVNASKWEADFKR